MIGGRRPRDALRDEHAATCDAKGCKEGDWPCRLLPSGLRLHLLPMGYNVRLIIATPLDNRTGYTDGWCYAKLSTPEAMIAFLTWNGEGDPPGPWIKQVTTGRQGPGSRLKVYIDDGDLK